MQSESYKDLKLMNEFVIIQNNRMHMRLSFDKTDRNKSTRVFIWKCKMSANVLTDV